MMTFRHALPCAGLLALVLMAGAAQADTTVRDASGNLVTIKGIDLDSGKKVPFSATYAAPVTATSSGGTITTAGASQQALAANTNRRGGYCQADPRNTDVLVFAFGAPASATPGAPSACVVTPGNPCGLTVSAGIFQGAVNVTSATQGSAFTCTESQ